MQIYFLVETITFFNLQIMDSELIPCISVVFFADLSTTEIPATNKLNCS